MNKSQLETADKTSKRNLIQRHNRASSDSQAKRDKSFETSPAPVVSNGLKAVSTVTGALHSFFRWSATPLTKTKKARSFDSLARSGSHHSLASLRAADDAMDIRRNSASHSKTSTPSPKTPAHKPHRNSADGSNMDTKDVELKRKDSGSREHIVRSRDSISSSVSAGSHGNRAGTPSRSVPGTSSAEKSADMVVSRKKSSDSSDSQAGQQGDLGGKIFEKSLNNILDKCSETSLDLTLDNSNKEDSSARAGKSSDRKKKSSPWYTMLSPTYKSRSEDFKKQFKNVPQDERLIVDYSCALQKEILVHGRMFVTQNWICFYANIFRWETIATIPTKEVLAITKEKTARVIPNAIQITTDKDKYFFTSYTARDKTFMMLFRLWQNALMDQAMSPRELWHWVHTSYGDELGLTSSDDDYVPPSNKEDAKRSKSDGSSYKGDSSHALPISDVQSVDDTESNLGDASFDDSLNVPPETINEENPTDCSDNTEDDESEVVCSLHDHLPKLAHNEVYQLPIEKLFELIFTDTQFFRDFTDARKLQEVTLNPWIDDTESETVGRVRLMRYTVPLSAPFGPKSSDTIEKQMCYKESQPGVMYVIDSECTPMGIPYADSFYVVSRYCLTRVTKTKCRLRVTSEVRYKKSVWGVVRNMIDRNSIQGVLDFFQCLGVHLRRESDKNLSIQAAPTLSKRKLRKRRSHAQRSAMPPSDLPVNSQATTKHLVDDSPRVAGSPREENLLKMNTETLIRIVCFILVLLVLFNAVLFYKLWSLETMANVLYFPDTQGTRDHFRKHPPRSQEEWVNLVNQQQRLHDTEMSQWREIIGASITVVDHMRTTLVDLKELVERNRMFTHSNLETPPSQPGESTSASAKNTS